MLQDACMLRTRVTFMDETFNLMSSLFFPASSPCLSRGCLICLQSCSHGHLIMHPIVAGTSVRSLLSTHKISRTEHFSTNAGFMAKVSSQPLRLWNIRSGARCSLKQEVVVSTASHHVLSSLSLFIAHLCLWRPVLLSHFYQFSFSVCP